MKRPVENGRAGKQRPVRSYRQRRAEAKAERLQRVKALRRSGDDELADRMAACRPADHRCGSGACPLCHTKLQQHLAAALWRFAQRECRPGEILVVITWVPGNATVPTAELHRRDHRNQMRAWKRRLTGLSLRWFVGGVDFSANGERDSGEPMVWFPHLYGVGVTSDVEALRRQLAADATTSAGTFRPSMVKR